LACAEACGIGNIAGGDGAFVAGNSSIASGVQSVAIGALANATADSAIAWTTILRGATTLAALIIIAWSGAAFAQQQQAETAPPPPVRQEFQQSPEWGKLPHMQLERQFAGPLQDTVIQRLRDPGDGTICYLYLPISAPHTPITATGFVQYGPNIIGTINCIPGIPAAGKHK
jgi:hypothetical protein